MAKRKRMPSWGRKKPRSKRRRVSKRRGGNRVTAWNTLTHKPVSTQMKRGRMLSRKAWKRTLWNQTITQPKYKSCATSVVSTTTPLGAATKTWAVISALSGSSPFWTVAGGLQQINFGIVPNLGVDLSYCIIRGGTISMMVSSRLANIDAIIISIELRRLKQQTRNTTDSANSNTAFDWLTAITGTARPLLATIDDMPDSGEYISRAYLQKTNVVIPGAMMTVDYRLPVERLDCAAFQRSARAYVWVVSVSQQNDVGAAVETFEMNYSHDLSFCPSADAI